MKRPVCHDTNGPFVFVSYSHENMEIVDDIILQLQAQHINVWFDVKLQYGIEWFEDVKKHVRMSQCAGAIFMVSESSLLSEPCMKELKLVMDSPLADGRYMAVNLMENIGIEQMVRKLARDWERVHTINAGESLLFRDSPAYGLYLEKMNKNVTYAGTDADSIDKMVKQIREKWKYSARFEGFPDGNVLHRGKTEYLPLLLDLTPSPFTFFLSADTDHGYAGTLKSACRLKNNWQEVQIQDFLADVFRPEPGCKGLILTAAQHDESYVRLMLDKRIKAPFCGMSFLIVFYSEERNTAERMLRKAAGVIESWRKENSGLTETGSIDEFLLKQADKHTDNQFLSAEALEDLYQRSKEQYFRTVLSGGAYAEKAVERLQEKEYRTAASYLFQQYPPFFSIQDMAYINLMADTGLTSRYNRNLFRSEDPA